MCPEDRLEECIGNGFHPCAMISSWHRVHCNCRKQPNRRRSSRKTQDCTQHRPPSPTADALEDRVKDRLDGHISARPQFPFCIYFLVHSSRGAPQSGAPPTARPPHDVRGTVARLWGNNRDECGLKSAHRPVVCCAGVGNTTPPPVSVLGIR